MQRTDRQWRTVSCDASTVEGMVFGATPAHPCQPLPDDLFAVRDGQIREVLLGPDAVDGTQLRSRWPCPAVAQDLDEAMTLACNR